MESAKVFDDQDHEQRHTQGEGGELEVMHRDRSREHPRDRTGRGAAAGRNLNGGSNQWPR